MNVPSLYEKFHWAAFNAVAKFFACGLIFVCSIFIILVVATMLGKPLGAEYSAWGLLLFIPFLVIGVLMVKAKPYYPEKYKDWYESKNKNA